MVRARLPPKLLPLLMFSTVAPYLGIPVNNDAVKSLTRGLVGDSQFAVLPDVPPKMAFMLTLAFQTVSSQQQLPPPHHASTPPKMQIYLLTTSNQLCLVKLWMKPTWDVFIGAVTLCGYASFLFGWHVHEKAVLLVIIPFSLLALKDRRYLGAFRPLAVSGHVSLFPLLFTAPEWPVKVIYTIFWLILFLVVFDRLAPPSSQPRVFLLDRFSVLYIAVVIPLIAYCSLVHQLVFGEKYEFLPLMFTSSYSALGVVGSWLGFMVVYFRS